MRLIEELVDLEQKPKVLGGVYMNAYLSELESDLVHGFHFDKYPKKGLRALFNAGNLWNEAYSILQSPDIIHETYFESSPILKGKSKARVTTIYDALHEKYPDLFPKAQLKTAEKQASFDRSDLIFSISNHTKQDTIELFNVPEEKVKVVHLAADPPIPENQIVYPKAMDRPFFLFVGIRMQHKNFNRFIQAFAASADLKREFDIVSIANFGFSQEEKQLFKDLDLQEDQVRHVKADDPLLAGFYKKAHAFVYPSIYEGFGIPPLEAMAYGCPVVCSNSSSLPEVVGDAALTFDPLNVEEMKTQLEKIAWDTELRNDFIEKGYAQTKRFSWKKMAQETLMHYQTLV